MSSRSTRPATKRSPASTQRFLRRPTGNLPLRTPLALAAAIVAVAFLASGCGAVGRVHNGDPSHGKALFLANPDPSKPACASCHTLADAKSTGTVGPNLDDAFSSVKQQGFALQSMEDLIRGQIAYPEPPMPANLLNGQDANDVATYIAKCAGNPDCGITPTKAAPPASTSSTTTTTAAPATTTTTSPSGGGALAEGKHIFQTIGCSSCHTLKDAHATGTVGPNLDQKKPSEARVAKQVTNGGKIMPPFKGRLTPAQIAAVAKYVASVAGK